MYWASLCFGGQGESTNKDRTQLISQIEEDVKSVSPKQTASCLKAHQSVQIRSGYAVTFVESE